MSQQEKNELNEFVNRYIAVWHEPDAERRRKRIAAFASTTSSNSINV